MDKMDNMTDAEKLARRIMARIEGDKAIHLSSIMEELATPRPVCAMSLGDWTELSLDIGPSDVFLVIDAP